MKRCSALLRGDKKTPNRRQTMNQSGAIGVTTWLARPLKFQAGTGLLPELAHYLLKPSALCCSAEDSVQLAGETA
jgi:hypothetical protein